MLSPRPVASSQYLHPRIGQLDGGSSSTVPPPHPAMWGRRKMTRRTSYWSCRLLPCRARQRDSALLKLTAIACLALPVYVLLFHHVSSLGSGGDGVASDGSGGPVPLSRDHQAPPGGDRPPFYRGQQQQNHRQPSDRTTERGLAVQPPGRAPVGSSAGDRWGNPGFTRSEDWRRMAGSNSSGHQRVQVIAATRVVYLGCYQDETERTLRALREGFIADVRRMTLSMCIRHCYKRGSYYAGLEFHSECYCGRRIYHSNPVNQSLCNATCAGNSSETCGGAPYLSMYQILTDERRGDQGRGDFVTPGVDGLAEDFRACVPRPDRPYQRAVFPNGYFTTAPKMTVESCITACYERLFPVAALGAGNECHCGRFSRDFRLEVTLAPRDCNVPCAGNENFFCGGESALSVYQTAAEDNRCSNISLRPVGTLPLVAVASFPGSGNTWVRYLIERATGIYTGSFYNDGDLFKKGFIGEKEKWTKGNTIAVKTHRFDEDHVRNFKAAILIIRNPYKAIISEHNRKFGGHVGFAPEMQYTKGTEWIAFVTGKSRTWANTAVNFIQYSRRLHVVYYEDLQNRLYETLRGVVDFLGVPVNEDRLLCVLSSPHGKFKRSGKRKNPLTFDPFTDEMREMVDLSLKTVSMALKLRNCTELPAEYNPKLQI